MNLLRIVDASWVSTFIHERQTFVMSESVARRLGGTALTPEHSSPHCVAEWGVSGFNGLANRFENLNCRCGPRSLVHCTHSIRIRRNRARERHSGINIL